jgi:hypothetical protein
MVPAPVLATKRYFPLISIVIPDGAESVLTEVIKAGTPLPPTE